MKNGMKNNVQDIRAKEFPYFPCLKGIFPEENEMFERNCNQRIFRLNTSFTPQSPSTEHLSQKCYTFEKKGMCQRTYIHMMRDGI
jgi:hypothetical protein